MSEKNQSRMLSGFFRRMAALCSARTKKLFFVLMILCLLPMVFFSAAKADAARDVTSECRFHLAYVATRVSYMRDRNYETVMESELMREPIITVTTGDTPVSAVYVEFGKSRLPFQVQVQQGKEWVTVASCGAYYAQEFVAFPPVTGEFRLSFISNGSASVISISEIHLLSEGEVDEEKYHVWRDTVSKADLMITVAHPDDELLWLGGMIPYYTAEREMNVLVTYLTCGKFWREHELLNGLWHCGVRNYPLIAYLPDFKTFYTEEVYARWDRTAVNKYIVQQIRHYRPEVVVTHALNGEYGHAQHIVCAYRTRQAVELAASADYDKSSYKKYGTWQVKKLYLHLGDSPTTVMDWHQPLNAFNGKTGFEIAGEAYRMHISQMGGSTYYDVADRGTEYDSFVYTLTYSAVGEDTAGGDLFENIPRDALTFFNPRIP